MLYSNLHSLYYRLINKLNRINKKKQWSSVPIQKSTTFFGKNSQLFDPHHVSAKNLGFQMQNQKIYVEVLEVLKK